MNAAASFRCFDWLGSWNLTNRLGKVEASATGGFSYLRFRQAAIGCQSRKKACDCPSSPSFLGVAKVGQFIATMWEKTWKTHTSNHLNLSTWHFWSGSHSPRASCADVRWNVTLMRRASSNPAELKLPKVVDSLMEIYHRSPGGEISCL